MNAISPHRTRGIVAVRAQTADVAALMAELGAGFREFKADFGRRLDGIERFADEQAKAVARLSVGGVGPVSGPGAEDAVRQFAATVRASTGRSVDMDASGYRDYIEAQNLYWRLGAAAPQSVQAAMNVGSDAAGGFFVDSERASDINRRIFESSPIRRMARVETIGSDMWEQIADVHDLEDGGWVAEMQARPETDAPRIAMQTIPVNEMYAMPRVTQKLLDDADRDIGSWLAEKITDRFIREEAKAFVTGDGIGKPRGFLSYGADATTEDDEDRDWGKLQYVASGSTTGFPKVSGSTSDDAGPLVSLMSKLKPDYLAGAVWLMKRSTAATVRQLRDADGRFLWMDSLTDGGRPLLLGHPVEFADHMPAIASDAFSIAFGNFRVGYTVVDRIGVRVLRDPFTTKGSVKFYATRRVGGDVTGFDAIKLLKFSST